MGRLSEREMPMIPLLPSFAGVTVGSRVSSHMDVLKLISEAHRAARAPATRANGRALL